GIGDDTAFGFAEPPRDQASRLRQEIGADHDVVRAAAERYRHDAAGAGRSSERIDDGRHWARTSISVGAPAGHPSGAHSYQIGDACAKTDHDRFGSYQSEA